MLTVHGGLLFWTIITFLILLVVLKKIAWKPILDALESREKEIKDAKNSSEYAEFLQMNEKLDSLSSEKNLLSFGTPQARSR